MRVRTSPLKLPPPPLSLQRMAARRMQLYTESPVCCRSSHLIRDQVAKAGGCGPGTTVRCCAAVLCQHNHVNITCERPPTMLPCPGHLPSLDPLPSCLVTDALSQMGPTSAAYSCHAACQRIAAESRMPTWITDVLADDPFCLCIISMRCLRCQSFCRLLLRVPR